MGTPLKEIGFRNQKIQLPFHTKKSLERDQLKRTIADPKLKTEKRILAAMGLASLRRVEKKIAIDMPCVDFGKAKIILFPGESFVGYQLMAQKIAGESFVFPIGYGECWPGYIPTRSAFDDSFEDSWLWAGRGSEKIIRSALDKLLDPK